jgi:hypothetical protein
MRDKDRRSVLYVEGAYDLSVVTAFYRREDNGKLS